jgi:pyruvate-formate lyase-activating enzyme
MTGTSPVEALRQACAGKKVYLWGAMIVGQGMCRALERIGVPVEAFLDSAPSLQGKSALGYPTLAPEAALAAARSGEALIIAASGHCDLEIGGLCESAGLCKGSSYLLCRDINQIDPSVDVAGMCNLRCISCPRGNEVQQPAKGYMRAAVYLQVLDKLLREIPLLGSVQLYAWGEPLLNPELPEIVAATRAAKVLSAISSNLNYAVHLEQVVAARPDWFKVSCSGWEASYERTHTGGRWDVFLPNLRRLAELRSRLHPEMQITVNYHLYRHNLDGDYRNMEALCEELGLIFRPSPAYLYPADAVMEYADGKELSEPARRTLPLLMMGLDEGLAKARERVALPCPEERCFPINWDCSVRACGVFFRPFIAENFLALPLAEILDRRRASGLCAECKKRGVHQFTGVYLAEKRVPSREGG